MAKHELTLLENATDSLNEALRKYEEGISGNTRAFKFAIIHFSHFFELLLKHYVTLAHPLLIYKNPFSRKIESEQTIGIWEAIQFLKNDGHEVPIEFDKELAWFKKLRNDIEHFKFSMDTEEVRTTLGRLMQAIYIFNDLVADFELNDQVEPDLLKTFENLADEYKAKLSNAWEQAQKNTVDDETYACWNCGEYKTVAFERDKFKCYFCGYEHKPIDCCVCGIPLPREAAMVWNSDHDPDIDYICEGCYEHIRSKD